MIQLHHTIIGLPESGKTTFLAALWHVVNSNEIESHFTLGELTGDHEYLNVISEAWRACKPVPRTSIADEKDVLIKLLDKSSQAKITLSVPDLSGETFERQVSSRVCEPSYIEGIQKLGGILLFLTANSVDDGIGILDAPALMDEPEKVEARKPWHPSLAPRQVKIVELLQFLHRRPFASKQHKLAIIISAWDLAREGVTPDKWVQTYHPLLEQYLRCNKNGYAVKIFGLSAQGGDFKTQSAELLKRSKASERIKCVINDVSNHDITLPLAWLSTGNEVD